MIVSDCGLNETGFGGKALKATQIKKSCVNLTDGEKKRRERVGQTGSHAEPAGEQLQTSAGFRRRKESLQPVSCDGTLTSITLSSLAHTGGKETQTHRQPEKDRHQKKKKRDKRGGRGIQKEDERKRQRQKEKQRKTETKRESEIKREIRRNRDTK